MPPTRVRELYVADLSELLEAEEQVLRELPLMAARATLPALRDAFEEHYRETQRHIARLTTIFGQLEERARPTAGPGIRALIEESRLRQAAIERGDLLDLALISSARRIEHYEIAGYETARTYARRLNDADAERLLAQSLEEESRTDQRLGYLAEASPTRTPAVPAPPQPVVESSPENELMVARGEPEDRADKALRREPE